MWFLPNLTLPLALLQWWLFVWACISTLRWLAPVLPGAKMYRMHWYKEDLGAYKHTFLSLHIKSTNSQPPSFPYQLSIEAVMPCWGEAGAPKHFGLDAISWLHWGLKGCWIGDARLRCGCSFSRADVSCFGWRLYLCTLAIHGSVGGWKVFATRYKPNVLRCPRCALKRPEVPLKKTSSGNWNFMVIRCSFSV